MGRLALRAGWDRPDLDFVHVNEPKGGSSAAAHLLTFDSLHGRWPHDVRARDDAFEIDGRSLRFTESPVPESIGWDGVDVVIECSGRFRTAASLQPHFAGGVRKIVVSAPVKRGALNIVMGINDHLYDDAEHDLVTAASCTTNCIAPVVKVVHERLGIKHGTITTLHAVTNTQAVVDAPHADLRRARSASVSLIPTTTGSATAITLIYPELRGKLDGLAVRVPVLNASIADCVFEVERRTEPEEVNRFFREAAETTLRGVLGYEELPLVSADFTGDTRSGIVDACSTMVVDGTQVKVLAWYDNEIGYVHRMIELVQKIAGGLRRAPLLASTRGA